MLINADLSQIEVIVFADYCQDPTLLDLLMKGRDIHRYIGKYLLDKPEDQITDSERKACKAGNFGIIYGNGAQTLSERTGNTVEWCKEFIETFYKLFPKAKEWQNKNLEIVNDCGELQLWTGMTLKFNKFPAKYQWQFDKGIKESYNPPDIKNHPVQHTAFMLQSILVGQFFREKAIHKRDKYLMINEVHDSLMLDCRAEFINEAIEDIQEIVDKVPNIVYSKWGRRIDLPIKVDIAVGERWSEL